MSKKVMTVLGPVDPETLGPTLTHEHIFVDTSCNFVYQEEASLQNLLHAPVSMSMLGLLRRRPFSVCLDNTRLSDESLAIEEVTRFQRAGGQTLVDCTVIGIRRDPVAVQRVARATGLNVVQGTGIYVEPSHPDWVATIKVEELAQMLIDDVRVGIAETGVRAGLIGEIGTSGVARSSSDYKRVGDITANEEKVLRAAGRASVETGAAVSVHLDVRGQGAFRIISILEEEGVAPDRMIMSHMDSVADLAYHKAIGERGVFVEYDSFGRDYYADEIGVSWGHDARRVEFLCEMLDSGFGEQMLLSQDVCLKIDLRAYGGNGYDHILTSAVGMFRRAGITEAQIAQMQVENPKRALAFDVAA